MIRSILILVLLVIVYIATQDLLTVYSIGVCCNIVDYMTDPDEYETDNTTVIIGSLFSFLVPIFNLLKHE